jgi:hypothetical protein
MVAIYGVVAIPLPAWRMGKTSSKVIKVSDWLKADAVIWIYLTNLLGYYIVSMLKIDALRKARYHH